MPLLFRSISLCHLGAILALCTFVTSTAPAQAAANCHTSKELHDALNIEGLKSQLMVTALSCKTQDRYNSFVNRFRPELTAAEKHIEIFFKGMYGRQGSKKRDDFITQLADVQSLGGLKSGTIFCDQRIPMFDEVTALETAKDLSQYAEAKDIVQPTSYENCAAPSPSRVKKRGRVRPRSHHR